MPRVVTSSSEECFVCNDCGQSFTNVSNLKRHGALHAPACHSCRVCSYKTKRRDNLLRHWRTYHRFTQDQIDNLAAGPSGAEQAGSGSSPSGTGEAVKTARLAGPIDDILKANMGYISDYQRVSGRFQDQYNFEITNPTTQKLMEQAELIFSRQEYAYKTNLAFGYVLYDNVSGAHEYYYPSCNVRVLDKPVTIRKQEDLAELRNSLDIQDILEHIKQQRLNSRFVVERITNVLWYVNKLKPFTIGCRVVLPPYVANKTSLVGLVKDRRGVPYTDHICIFRCLAYHTVGCNFEARAQELAHEYFAHKGITAHGFKGVPLSDLVSVENLFELNIEVYRLVPMRGNAGEDIIAAKKILTSRKSYEGTVNVHLYQNHFSYVTNLNKFSRCWTCGKCRKLFPRVHNMVVHQRNCLNATKLEYPGGGFGLPKSVFDQLLEVGCRVPRRLQFYPYRACFDFETFSEETRGNDPEAKLQFLKTLIPASVSVCSNVPGFGTPKFFLSNGDVNALIAAMWGYVIDIADTAYELLCAEFVDIIAWLEEKKEEIDELKARIDEMIQRTKDEGVDFTADEEREYAELRGAAYRGKVYVSLTQRLESWLRQLPLLGFNSGKFDVALIRKWFFPFLLENEIEIKGIIKKNSSYLAITTEKLIILDQTNFIAPGTSYAKWLKSVDVPFQKGHWPYSWFVRLDQLKEKELVTQEHFYSTLTRETISDEDYAYLQRVWRDENFQSMGDLLRWYNNGDTEGFIAAAGKVHDHWKELAIDTYKGGAISLPGLALILLTKRMQPHTILPLIKEPEDFNIVKDNITGGLAIVFHRYMERGVTELPNGETPEIIYSHDCNALYLSALADEMGTGIYATWTPSGGEGVPSMEWERSTDGARIMKWHDVKQTNEEVIFQRRSSYPFLQAQTEWLEYMSYSQNMTIEHIFNGREKVIHISEMTHYPVDGYDPSTNTVYQFHGCLWHGHGCSLDTEKDMTLRARRLARTREVERNIADLGYDMHTIWECAWKEQRRGDPTIDEFLEEHLRLKIKVNRLSGRDIVDHICSGQMFGMALVDVEVPWWNEDLIDYFEMFPPIYKNREIGLTDIHGLMRRYAEEHGLLNKPRRTLINSFFGRSILLTTPLLQWYLRKGLAITKVHKVFEMKGKRCFEDLKNEIVANRRRGDEDPRLKPTGELWRLVGNSCYGKSCTNKMKHKDTKIALDNLISKYINDRRFSKMDEVGNNAYEVDLDKKKIKFDLPITVGYFVYNQSKLRMLEFVFDFIKHYFMTGSFALIASDTDSIMWAVQKADLDQMVKPELREEYHAIGKRKFLVVSDDDLRTPGLFKVEREATGAVALCSKTYFTWNDDDQSVKLSTKGLSKRTNTFSKEDFLRVLDTRVAGMGVNTGLRLKGTQMMEYVQEKAGLSYFYIKRHVHDDGVTTSALDL